jgi:hypothetical protein
MKRRYRSTTARAPAAPRDARQRIEQIQTGADMFPWRANETVYGPDPKRDAFWTRLELLYGHHGRK